MIWGHIDPTNGYFKVVRGIGRTETGGRTFKSRLRHNTQMRLLLYDMMHDTMRYDMIYDTI